MKTKLSNPKWHDVLLAIHRSREQGRYCEKLNRKVKASMTHLRAIVRRLHRQRLIEIIPTKRNKRLELTDKGRRVSSSILSIRGELGLMA